MYEVVSRGIIRQALQWMNMPKVQLELCQNFSFPNNLQTCAYRAHFSAEMAQRRIVMERKLTGRFEFGFDALLEECFARDITVIPEPVIPWSGEVTYILVCRLTPHSNDAESARDGSDKHNDNSQSNQGFYSPDEQTVMSDIPF